MSLHRVFMLVSLVLVSQNAHAQQVPATNDIASCALIGDPTAQRLCIESARQSRPASTFDPTAQKQRQERRPPPGRDAMSPAGKPAPGGSSGVKPGTGAPAAGTTESYRETKWRLQIP